MAVHVLNTLPEAPALPLLAARRRRVRTVEPVREDRLRDVDVDPADLVDQRLEVPEVDDDDVVDGQAGEVRDRPDRERGAAELERRVDLVVAVAGDRHAQVARDREVHEPVASGVGAQQHDRVGVLVGGARSERGVVGAEQQDRARVGEQQPVLLGERALRPGRQPLVVAGDAPYDQHEQQHDQPDADPPLPAPAASLPPMDGPAAVRRGTVAPARVAARRVDAPLQRHLAFGAAAAVDAIRLFSRGHREG